MTPETGLVDAENTAKGPAREAQGMVLKYANMLVNNERAQQFATQIAVMARKEPKLLQCSADSLVTAMMACVHLDLMPNTPEQYAFIIPYNNRKYGRIDAQFQLGYKGMTELAYRSNQILSINSELVFEDDKFETDFATRTISHKPDLTLDRTDWSKAKAVYAVAKLPNGELAFDVLSRSEVDKVKGTVKAGSTDTPWSKWPEAMVKKTAVKRLLKYLPQSSGDNRLNYAAHYDSLAEVGKLRMDQKTGALKEDPIKIEPTPEDQEKIKKEAAEIAAKRKAESKTEGGDEPTT